MSSAAAAVAVAQAFANGHGRCRQSGARPSPASVRVAPPPPASPVASRAVSMGGAATFTTRDSTELLLAAARASASAASASSSSPTTKDVKEAAKPPPQQPPSLSSKFSSTQLRVAYQGVPGAYSEAAAMDAYPSGEAVPCDQFEEAFQAVEQWMVDRAVLPIENSLGGSIHRNYDLLLRHRLHIVGEVYHRVEHCLLALPGVEIKDIRRVMSHPQALAQTQDYLDKMNVAKEATHDTAASAQFIAREGLRDAAAVASERAAKLYGLNILDSGIQDDEGNVTRFLALAREPVSLRPDVLCKTSIVFSLEEGPGTLFKALSTFALRDINLTKIESRPLRTQPLRDTSADPLGDMGRRFDYLFYIDFAASMSEQRAQNALRHLQEFAPFLRVLGSYPMATFNG